MDRTGVEQMTEGSGKIVARRVHEDVGADLDLDADDIEPLAATAARAVARGPIEELLERTGSSSAPTRPARPASGPASCAARNERSTSGAASLPWTTSHVESTVKIVNRRVKGTEKSWGEAGAEAILRLRAAFLSEDGRLERHLQQRPCSPYRDDKTRRPGKAA
jgi:hypothetical protein